MNSLFNTDGKFFQILDKLSNLVLLNILWLICCIPIITIGASTTALYYVMLKVVRDEDSYIIRSFFKSFLANLRQATAIWVLVLCFLGILYFDFSILKLNPTPAFRIITVLLYVLILLFAMAMCYVFPLLAKFDNTIFNTVKNAMILSVVNAPRTFLLLAWTVVPILMLYQFVGFMLPVSVLFGVAVVAYYKSKIYVKIFDKLIPVEEPEEEQVDSFEKED